MTKLYALQKDLDMLTEKVDTFKKSYDLLDYIAGVIHDLQMEFTVLGEQMTRLENRVAALENRMEKIEKNTEERFKSIESTLQLIVKHFGIAQ